MAKGPKPKPKGEQRAVREGGRRMRSALLDAAIPLFREKGLSGVSVAEIAEAAGGYPNQITYYFRSKEALFVEGACRDVLYLAQRMEDAAARAREGESYTRALVEAVMGDDALGLFVEAMALTRRRQDLAPLIARTFERLHAEGDRAYGDVKSRRGWTGGDEPRVSARRFWTLAIGLALREDATGASDAEAVEEMITLLRRAPERETKPRLAVVGES
jgi:AcrR family transcriptional regulator